MATAPDFDSIRASLAATVRPALLCPECRQPMEIEFGYRSKCYWVSHARAGWYFARNVFQRCGLYERGASWGLHPSEPELRTAFSSGQVHFPSPDAMAAIQSMINDGIEMLRMRKRKRGQAWDKRTEMEMNFALSVF